MPVLVRLEGLDEAGALAEGFWFQGRSRPAWL